MAQRPWTGGDTPVDGSPDSSPSTLRGRAPASRGAASCGPRRRRPRALLDQPAGRLRHRGHQADRRHLQEHGPVRDAEGADLLQLAALHGRGRQEVPRPSTTSRSSRGSRSPTTRDVNGNNEFFAKVRNQLGACEPVGRDIFVLTDWMAARMVELGWIQKLDHGQHAERRGQPGRPASRAPPGTRTASYSRPVAERPDRHRLQREVHRRGRAASRSWSPAPTSRARSRLLSEMGDTMGFMLKMVGADPDDFNDDEWDKATRRARGDRRLRPGPPFTGNDYTRPLNNGDVVPARPGPAT